jgi:hypothetical protein
MTDPSTLAPGTSGCFRWPDASCLLVFLITAVGVQVLSSSYQSELAHHPDEPGQFLTGLMVFDYLKTCLNTDPLSFAEDYYVHYPKVAFGHWPPTFFVIQALFFSLFGPTPSSALILVLLCTFAIAACLYTRLRRYHGRTLAFFAAICFLTLPMVRAYSSMVLADMLATLFIALAVFSLADFFLSTNFRSSLWFGGWSSLALLTKGNAAPLALLPPIALVAMGKFRLLSTWKFWFPAVLVLIACAPFYLITLPMAVNVSGANSSGGVLPPTDYLLYNMRRFPPLSQFLGLGILAFAVLGGLSIFRSGSPNAKGLGSVTDLKVSLASILCFFLFELAFPITENDPRYLLPVLPAAFVLFARGVSVCQGWLMRWPWPMRYTLSAAIVLGIFLPQPSRALQPIEGYGTVVNAIPLQKQTVVLVSSGSIGEGALVVEQRLRDPKRETFVLRGSKVLGISAWNGRSYKLWFHTPEEIQEYLNRIPVHFLILDDYGYSREPKDPHHELLRQTVESCPDNFLFVGRFPITVGSEQVHPKVLLYENKRAKGRLPEEIRMDVTRMLGRELKTKHSRSSEKE